MAEYNIRPFPCMRGGMHIFAREYLPGRSGPLPAVILSHGFSANADGLDAYARLFAENGYAAYTFDFCGGSKPGTGRSDGDTLGMTLASERADLIAMADAVTALPYIDAGRLVLFGASQGGFVSGLAAAKLQDRVWRLIMLYPALCMRGWAASAAAAIPRAIRRISSNARTACGSAGPITTKPPRWIPFSKSPAITARC